MKRRKDIERLVNRYKEAARYNELAEDDLILLWMCEHLLELTKDMKEPPEEERKEGEVPEWVRRELLPGDIAVFDGGEWWIRTT